MLGELLERAVVGERGVDGDRAFAIVDAETGTIASAKDPQRWGVLFECRAACVAPAVVEITLPDGTRVTSDDARVHDVLSRAFGRTVRLESRAPAEPVLDAYWPDIDGVEAERRGQTTKERIALVAPGTFFDAAPLHLVTTATMARLRELEPASSFDVRRFRPNVVVAVEDPPGFPENDWVGRTANLGTELQASVFLGAPRCVMTTLAQGDLPRDNGVLQAIARHNRYDIPGLGPSSCVGVYALVAAAGTVRTGDEATLS
jgi:uncharacterized protein YcbX